MNDMVDENGQLKKGDEDHEEGRRVAVKLLHVGESSDETFDLRNKVRITHCRNSFCFFSGFLDI